MSFKAYENQTAYTSSKWAIRGLTEALRVELKKNDCRVIGFYPGGLKSRFVEKATGVKADMNPYMNTKHIAQIMLNILNLPKDIEVSEIIINRKSL